MSSVRFAPPKASLESAGASFTAPGGVQLRLRAGLVLPLLQAMVMLAQASAEISGIPHMTFIMMAWMVGPIVVFLLAFGIYRWSRVCALLLLAVIVAPTAALYLRAVSMTISNLWILEVGSCLLCVYATFEYHRLRARARAMSRTRPATTAGEPSR